MPAVRFRVSGFRCQQYGPEDVGDYQTLSSVVICHLSSVS